jgi:hypothetical protein
LREAGRALALDPKSDAATAFVARLLLDPPATMPPEARDASSVARRTEQANAVRLTAFGLASILPLALALPFCSEIRDYRVMAMMGVSLLLSTAHAFFAVRASPDAQIRHSLVITLEFLPFIAGLSLVVAPYLLAPIVALGGASLVAISHWLGRMRAPIIALFCLAVGVIAAVLWRYAGLVEANRELQDLHTWHLEHLASRDAPGVKHEEEKRP